VCFINEKELSTSLLVALLCSAFWWEGPTQWALRGGTVDFTILGRVGQVVFFAVLGFIIVGLCFCASVLAGVRFAQYTTVTLVKLRAYLDRDEIERRGKRRERSCVQSTLLWFSCYGCCGVFKGLCSAGYENGPTWRDRLRGAMRLFTCWLVPRHYEDGSPPTTWRWWARDWLSWLTCRGCGVVPELAREPKEYAPTESERAAEEEKEMLQGEWKGKSPAQIQAVFRQHAAAEVARGRARMWARA
jgi:hypothetical protein